jgi:long-chain acyl-CoA synthetase
VQFIRLGADVKGFERPTQWLPIAHPFSQENQMLTPKLSLRRVNIVAAYKAAVDALYAQQGNRVQYPSSHATAAAHAE